jgi:putative transposase
MLGQMLKYEKIVKKTSCVIFSKFRFQMLFKKCQLRYEACPNIHHRHSVRLQGYDYSKTGAYFITICTKDRECLFGDIVNGKMLLNEAGKMIQMSWQDLLTRFDNMVIDESVVMPNHVHGLVMLSCRGEACLRPQSSVNQGDHKDRPYGTQPHSIGRIVQAFKSITTHKYIQGVRHSSWLPFPSKLWQRNYWDHIIQDESELETIREYIVNNPALWESDQLHPAYEQAAGGSQ